MFNGFVENVGLYIHTNVWLALAAVFLGGMLTASNPCVLAMIPLMMSFVAGSKDDKRSVFRAFSFSLIFVLGLAVTFTALGMVAALAGKMYGDVSSVWNWLVAAVLRSHGVTLHGSGDRPYPRARRSIAAKDSRDCRGVPTRTPFRFGIGSLRGTHSHRLAHVSGGVEGVGRLGRYIASRLRAWSQRAHLDCRDIHGGCPRPHREPENQ